MVSKRISDLDEDTTPEAADDFVMDTAAGTKRIPYANVASEIHADAPFGVPVNVTKAAAAEGVSTDFARADHKHDITTAEPDPVEVGQSAEEGTATTLARSDHRHAVAAPPAPANVTKAAASAGVSTVPARADHKHDITTAAPSAIGIANAEGSSSSLARADHVHDVRDAIDSILGGQKIAMFAPQGDGTTAVGLLGWGDSVTGTATGRAMANTNYFTSLRRKGYVSAAGVGSIAGTRNNCAMVWRGDAAGLGGFYIRFRFGLSLLSGGENRSFVGLRLTTGVMGDGQPSAQLNVIALAADVGDSNWQIMHNDGSGACTKVDLGANFPYPGTVNQDCYSLELWCAPNASSVNYRVTRENTGDVASGEISSNLPSSATFLAPQCWTNSGATNASVAVDVVGQYSRVGVA